MSARGCVSVRTISVIRTMRGHRRMDLHLSHHCIDVLLHTSVQEYISDTCSARLRQNFRTQDPYNPVNQAAESLCYFSEME